MFFFFQAEDGIRDGHVTGVQTCALPILPAVIEALARAVDDIRADPTVAVEAAAVHIPGTMSPEDEAAALLTAEAMVELYGTGDFGQQDPAAWDEMALFMDQMGLLDRSVAADEAYTDEFTPAQ